MDRIREAGSSFLDDMPYVRMNVAAAPAMLLPQVLELPSKVDKVVDFAWEPKGTRFGVLHGEGPRPTFSLYEMNDMKSTARGVQLVNSQPNKQANCLHWSPQVRPAQLIAAYELTHSGHREQQCSLHCVGLVSRGVGAVLSEAFVKMLYWSTYCIMCGKRCCTDYLDTARSTYSSIAQSKRSSLITAGFCAQGKFLVLGGLKSMSGQLEFFSADEFDIMNAAEHFMCTNVDWDPTGRYVCTSVQVHQMENGFNIWLFNGQLLYRCVPTFMAVAHL